MGSVVLSIYLMLSYVRMCFRQLKNKDEDRVVENNECLPHAMLGSYNDLARPLHVSSTGICSNVMASRQKGNPEYNENHSLHYKVTDSGEEHESVFTAALLLFLAEMRALNVTGASCDHKSGLRREHTISREKIEKEWEEAETETDSKRNKAMGVEDEDNDGTDNNNNEKDTLPFPFVDPIVTNWKHYLAKRALSAQPFITLDKADLA
ncbi:hypothetical protein HID58_038051 [Brassica napus]|uniref:Uncharacterized protein n=1 Tax=Brassica napus TaxID=3708 RepID=A0ABQ8BN85_BRANA|nr:hypothetical protein HID58_038051 [Brassica napus]